MKIDKIKKFILNLAPLIGLFLLYMSFITIGNMKDINVAYGMKAIINQSVVVAIVATGAIFIYSLGSFDISLGASAAVSALMGAIAYNKTGSLIIMLTVCVLVAVGVSFFNSSLASIFNLPVFVTTIAMLSILNAVILLLIKMNGTGSEIAVSAEAVRSLDNVGFKVLVLGVFLIVCILIFDFTKVGRYQKLLGGNSVCAKLTGISNKKMALVAFVIAGIGVGLGAFISITYAPTLTKNTASSIGMDVIIAIVFGGMPISGGARSKIYAAVIGAFSMTFLSQTMSLFSLNSGIGQMVKAVIFIVVVFIATVNHREKLLPR